MDLRTKRNVIASLLKAGRPDLAQCVAGVATSRRVGYWEKNVKALQGASNGLRKSVLFHADYVRKAQGNQSYLYKNLIEAASLLDQFSALVDPLKGGVEEGVTPLPPRGQRPRPSLRAAEVHRAG